MSEPQPSTGPSELTWVAKLPLMRDPVFVRQMSLVFVIPLVIVGMLLVVLEWPPDAEQMGSILRVVLIVGGVMLALYLFVIFGVLRGRQELRYTLDAKGASEQTAGPLKHINVVRMLLMLTGKPTYVGIGMITRGPVSERVTWKRVEKVVPEPQALTITLRKGRTDLMVIRCTEESFEPALSWAQSHMGRT
jgi:hypothetical protein